MVVGIIFVVGVVVVVFWVFNVELIFCRLLVVVVSVFGWVVINDM